MKKALVVLAMIMGMGTSVAFAHVLELTTVAEQTQQDPQEVFTKIEVIDIPQVILDTLGKEYDGAIIKEASVAERETGKVYKVILTVTLDDQSAKEVTVLVNKKGKIIKE
ncbi:hypothetical protein [uncultured Bacteroides sp.]|uniref:hypothetical protein n=1 Tax=uncultured Bacteroides sp. TaxID=162156 RepID=UPI0025DE1790|nr:hypothetical protein [uncultured Bacteroides sp.]